MSRIEKLALGTVQWGMAYGIANRSGQTPFAEVGRLLRAAKVNGITLLDTAHAYGEAEKILGEQGVTAQDFRVVTKTLPLNVEEVTEQEVAQVSAAFLESLQRLQCAKVYGLLVHRADNLLGAGGWRLWAALQNFKAQNRVDKIGVSVYYPHQVEQILDQFQIELVQLPVNIYDQRFVQSGLLRRLEQAGVEVHARSVFLQGLLLLPPDKMPKHFSTIRKHQAQLHKHLSEAGISPLEGALSFCLDQPDIDQIIVGCENLIQLTEILCKTRREAKWSLGLDNFSINDESMIMPSEWHE